MAVKEYASSEGVGGACPGQAAPATNPTPENVGGTNSDQTPMEWNLENEVHLFYAMTFHKPVGVNKHFQMACIQDKLQTDLNCCISSRMIWDHLDTLYDLQALDDSEVLPFPNNQADFRLPDDDFAALLQEKQRVTEKDVRKTKGKGDNNEDDEGNNGGGVGGLGPPTKKRGWNGRLKDDSGTPKRRRT